MLRTLAIHDDASTPLHVVLRPSSTWFQHCITILDEPIDTAADLKRLLWNDLQYDFAAYPGPMFRAVVTYVREENCAGLVYMIQHSVFDGISLEFFLQDLDALLVAGKTTSSSSSSSLPQRVPLPRIDRIRIPIPHLSSSANFCTIVYQSPSRHSFPSTQPYFLDKKLPEWFKGDSTGWIDESTGKPGPERKLASSEEKENQKEEANSVTRLSQEISLSPRYTTPQTRPRHRHLHSHESCSRLPQYQIHGAQNRVVCRIFCSEKFLGHTFRSGCRGVLPQPMEVDGLTVQKVVVAIEVLLTGGAGEGGEEGEEERGILFWGFCSNCKKSRI